MLFPRAVPMLTSPAAAAPSARAATAGGRSAPDRGRFDGYRPMFEKLKAAWTSLTSGPGAGAADAPAEPPIEYKGYRIRAAPYIANGQYQTAGVIEKDAPEGVKQHQIGRAHV